MTLAIQVHKVGGPEVLTVAEVELDAPLRGEARVRHTAIGVNFIDVYFRSGLYAAPGFPFVPGIEGAGIVEAVGAGVSEVSVGDRVAYASRPLGAYARIRNIPANRLVKIPEGIDDKLAAAILLKGMTAHYLVRRTFHVERGHTVLVHAAAGGVGSLLCQWAHHSMARVIGTVGNDEKAQRARDDGCDFPVIYTREDFVERVMTITDGRGVDVVYDSVGSDTFEKSIDCLAPLGMLVSFGQSSGPVGLVDLARLAKKSLFLTRPSLLDYTAKREDLVASANEVFSLVQRSVLRCRIGRTYPLKDVAQAHRDLEARKTVGSIVLAP